MLRTGRLWARAELWGPVTADPDAEGQVSVMVPTGIMVVPTGFMVFTAVMALSAMAALLGPARPRWLGVGAALLTTVVNELPLVFLILLAHATVVAVTADRLLHTPAGWLLLTVAVATQAAFLLVLRRGWHARDAVATALVGTFGTASRVRGTRPAWWTLLTPVPVKPWRVRRVRNVRYGPDRRRNRMDVYRLRSRPVDAPVLVYLHGGGYFSGSKRREAQAMLHRFADLGWIVISATYRLRPRVRFPDHLIDVKRVLAWVHRHGTEFGADPARLVLAGSSAGAHLTALSALTRNEPAFQPGFEQENTGVSAAVCLYGWYGAYYGRSEGERPSSSPLHHGASGAPPFFIAHGDHDGYTPVSGARALHRKLRTEATTPVVYVELPGAQHGFDLFRSLRSDAVVAGIEQFTAQVLAASRDGGSSPAPAVTSPAAHR